MKIFGIQFYNPFKPHIVVDAFGIYWVRKYVLFWGWKYYGAYGYFFPNKIWADYRKELAFAQDSLTEAFLYEQKEKERNKKLKTHDKVVHEE